jgi:hypothetical protein
MARPRVFISSTFFDLKQVRQDLERFVRDMGYEPVAHEKGQIPYGIGERLEKYCYKEIGQIDILVHIVGGRFGSMSYDEAYSVSQMELKTAVERNKQVYVFVDSSVYAEYRMYLSNKAVEGIRYVSADDKRILAFIEEIEALPRNNQLIEFRHSDEIVVHLREQWAGLFQRFLQEQEQTQDRLVAEDMRTALATVQQLITFLTEERRQQGSAVHGILLVNHPLFAQLRRVTATPYPLFLPTRKDVAAWLQARGWAAIREDQWDDKNVEEWMAPAEKGKQRKILKIDCAVFEGRRTTTCRSKGGGFSFELRTQTRHRRRHGRYLNGPIYCDV